jgi:hypothetical protein
MNARSPNGTCDIASAGDSVLYTKPSTALTIISCSSCCFRSTSTDLSAPWACWNACSCRPSWVRAGGGDSVE